MAKRLSKALRGKRRWLGVLVSPDIKSKSQMISSIEKLSQKLELSSIPKLMDFSINQLSDGCGTGILQVKLVDSFVIREHLEADDSLKKNGFSSLTTSGKIRLVRERISNLD
tara:strand:- start:459 stop:794 length:336 start_codon:yes stop_codon:yes gene_type:complete